MFAFPLVALLASTLAFGNATQTKSEDQENSFQALLGIMKNMMVDNASFSKEHGESYFKVFATKQAPRAVVIGCSDSRFNFHAIDQTPDNDLFGIKVIGNNFKTGAAQAAAMYGVNHLGAKVIMIIGHTSCGAIKAASEGFDTLEGPIQAELKMLSIKHHEPKISSEHLNENVVINIHAQVFHAMKKFEEKVRTGSLYVVGGIYHIEDGKLEFININGDTSLNKIAKIKAEAMEKGLH